MTTDLLTEGVDFRLAEVELARVGRKALAVNLSDIAAMAGTPTAAFVSLALPRNEPLAMAKGLYEGMLRLAAEYSVAIAGGDTNVWDGGLVISVTLLGNEHRRGALRRDGARPGDAIVVTGRFGGSILGRQFDFTPRVREAALLHERYELRAGIDVSDGLSLDLARLCEASGCGAEVDLGRIPIDSAAEELSRRDGRSALEHALGDGEDFELILAVPLDVAERMVADAAVEVPLTIIGRFVEQPGLWIKHEDGLRALEPRGFLHGESRG